MDCTKKVLLLSLAVAAVAYWIQPYRPVIVQGDSMAPTLTSGQLLVSKRPSRDLRAGDIVLVERDGAMIVKRVALAPGDRYLEGYYRLSSSWIRVTTAKQREQIRNGLVPGRWVRVPDDEVYLLGDNADVSLDSRMFGFVPVSSVHGIIQLGDSV